MSGADVFLSYCRKDREAARHFAERLGEEGFSVWWDAALRAGETFDEVIEAALKSAKAVVVLWSPRAVASRWVRAEATLADRRNKLIPAMIEPCDLPIIFELMHTTDLSDWDGSASDPAWRTMMEDLTALVRRSSGDSAGQPAPARSFPAKPSPLAAAPEPSEPAAKPNPPIAIVRAPPRKLNNLIFKPLEGLDSPMQSNGASADDDDDESTRFYTGSSPYADDRFHCLELTIGERVEKRFVVSPTGLKIGRAAPSDVILADSRVSRSHCVVQLNDGELTVSDLRSTNGTFVDGERVDDPTILPVGSILKVGNVSFRHQLRTSADV